MSIRVLIADDHILVAEALRHLLEAEPDIEVVGCAVNGREAIRATLETDPDVVLMDHVMPILNGTEATSLLCEQRPATRVIMLSMYSDAVHVCRALQAGASGYVLKKSVAREVIEAIRAAHQGQRYLSAPLLDGVLGQVVASDVPADPLERLSARERQVMQMLAEGHGVADIATALALSPKTVETYRARLMEKLGLHGLAALVRFAVRHGVVSPAE